MEYISAAKAADKWNISVRRVQQYCRSGRIAGTTQVGRAWMIPAFAPKPEDPRRKEASAGSGWGGQEESAPYRLPPADFFFNRQGRNEIGAVIAAAGEFEDSKGISPFMDIGGISLIKRVILNFQQASVYAIVVITGYQSYELEHHLSDYGVIFLKNQNYRTSDKLESLKIGLDFLKDKCRKVFFTSLKIPMFTADTLIRLCEQDHSVTVPSYHHRTGHPVLLDAGIIPSILEYSGPGGMRGALNAAGVKQTHVAVEDAGVLVSAENIDRLYDILAEHNQQLLHPFIRLSIEKQSRFFDGRCRLLLVLIKECHSVSKACKQMALSNKKAWDLINKLEQELGFTVVERHRGGSRSRKTTLTKKGEAFLNFFTEFEYRVNLYAKEQFYKEWDLFPK